MGATVENPAVPVCRMLTPVGMLGYGFNEEETHSALERLTQDSTPLAVILDSGSTDSGPKKLASGDMTMPRSSYERDVSRLLDAVTKYSVPLMIGSAGGAGTNAQVDAIAEMIRQTCAERGYSLKLVKIYADIPHDLVSTRLHSGKITPCGKAVPELQQKDVDEAPVIVAQMGAEPYTEAMKQVPDFDIILGGRAHDPAPYVAFAESCVRRVVPDYDTDKHAALQINGGIAHAAKIMECGGQCSVPKSRGAISTIYSDGSFEISPTDPLSICTPLSVAAHTMYEKSRPDILLAPGGWLDLSKAEYTQQADGRTTRCQGAVWESSLRNSAPYQIKLEAARTSGYRALYMGEHRDPILISQIDSILARIKDYVPTQVPGLEKGEWDLEWHIYGRDCDGTPRSLFLVGECRAKTQDLANSIAATARIASAHVSYPGQKATSGNFAFGIGAAIEIPLGLVPEFCIYHLMDLKPGEEVSLFKIKAETIDNGPRRNGDGHVSVNGKTEKPKTHTAQATTNGKQAPPSSHIDNIEPKTIYDVADVLGSKNAGPYEITFDIIFKNPAVFQAIKASNLLSAERVAALYDLRPDQLVWSGYFDQALAFKATIPRMTLGAAASSGGFFESDVHGSQAYMPLAQLELPLELQKRIKDILAR